MGYQGERIGSEVEDQGRSQAGTRNGVGSRRAAIARIGNGAWFSGTGSGICSSKRQVAGCLAGVDL